MYIYFSNEMGLGKSAVAHLKRCVYGTRDAGQLWEPCYSEMQCPIGFRQGMSWPTALDHPTKKESYGRALR